MQKNRKCVSDMWLTMNRNSVWVRNELDVTYVLSFISLLHVAQHVSVNHVPIFRSWRLRSFIATCWYCAVTMSGVYSYMSPCEWAVCGYVGCRGWWSHPHITTHSPLTERHIWITLLIVTAQYHHVAITLRSRQLLKMGTWLPETCWATCKREIKDNT